MCGAPPKSHSKHRKHKHKHHHHSWPADDVVIKRNKRKGYEQKVTRRTPRNSEPVVCRSTSRRVSETIRVDGDVTH